MAVPCGGLSPSFYCSVLACYTQHTYGTYKAFMPSFSVSANGGKPVCHQAQTIEKEAGVS